MTYRRLVTNGMLWNLFQIVVERALQTLIFFLVAQLIGPISFGLAAIAIAPMAVLVTILQGGKLAIIQHPDLDASSTNSLFALSVFLGIGFSLLIVAAAPHIAAGMRSPELEALIFGTAIGPFIASLGVVPEGLLARRFAFRLLAIRRTIGVAVAGSL